MFCVIGVKNIFLRWQEGDSLPTSVQCVVWWVQKTSKKEEDKTI